MFGFGFALVPFYDKICEVTGLRNIDAAPTSSANTQVDATRTVRIELDANVRKLPWRFQPLRADRRRCIRASCAQVDVRGRQHARPRRDRPGDPELRPAARRRSTSASSTASASRSRRCAGRARRDAGGVRASIRRCPPTSHTITLSYTFFEVEGGGGVKRWRRKATAAPDQRASATAKRRGTRRGVTDERSAQPAPSPITTSRSRRTGRSWARSRCCCMAHGRARSGSTAYGRRARGMALAGFCVARLHDVRLVRHGDPRIRGRQVQQAGRHLVPLGHELVHLLAR